MTSISDFISRLIKSLIAAIAAIFGAGKEAGSLLANDARRVGRVARRVGEAAARVVGTGLAGPARVLDGLAGGMGGLLPRGAAGPKQVADEAVEHDHTGYQIPAATKTRWRRRRWRATGFSSLQPPGPGATRTWRSTTTWICRLTSGRGSTH